MLEAVFREISCFLIFLRCYCILSFSCCFNKWSGLLKRRTFWPCFSELRWDIPLVIMTLTALLRPHMDGKFDDSWQCHLYELYNLGRQKVIRKLDAQEHGSIIQSRTSYDKGVRINNVSIWIRIRNGFLCTHISEGRNS